MPTACLAASALCVTLLAAAAAAAGTQSQPGDILDVWHRAENVTEVERLEWRGETREFVQAVVARGRPVLISGAPSSRWGAITRPWTPETLVALANATAKLT
jgi:cytochrome c-type biogenesis protein CcmH/NrfG